MQKATNKKPRKPKELENQPGRYDERNTLNDLTGKEWLILTKSFWETEPSQLDRTAFAHPAPFMVNDVRKLISMFTKRGMTVLDPFVGSGTTLIAANCIDRNCIGIDLNPSYFELYCNRIHENNIVISNHLDYLVGNAFDVIDTIGEVDYIVTSPPYFNILKNSSKGTRNNSGKSFRMAAREGVEYYSNLTDDIGNLDDYSVFLTLLQQILEKSCVHLRSRKYITLIMSDFTVNKKEQSVQCDIIRIMQALGLEFCGTTVLLQPVKPLFPFGYPYSYKINHHHQNIMTFKKTASLSVH